MRFEFNEELFFSKFRMLLNLGGIISLLFKDANLVKSLKKYIILPKRNTIFKISKNQKMAKFDKKTTSKASLMILLTLMMTF